MTSFHVGYTLLQCGHAGTSSFSFSVADEDARDCLAAALAFEEGGESNPVALAFSELWFGRMLEELANEAENEDEGGESLVVEMQQLGAAQLVQAQKICQARGGDPLVAENQRPAVSPLLQQRDQ